jgi:hypothetical protein
MKPFPARRDGYCGRCTKPISVGESITRLKTPRRLRLPGRYGDVYRPRIVDVNYWHADCEKETG